MNDKPRHRSFQFSLRGLFVTVTLVCLALGGRIGYLKWLPYFHDRETEKLMSAIQAEQQLSTEEIQVAVRVYQEEKLAAASKPFHFVAFPVGGKRMIFVKFDEKFRRIEHHQELAALYRSKPFPPWERIEEPPMVKVFPTPITPPSLRRGFQPGEY